MEDPTNSRAISFSLPQGCRFFPSDQQLLLYYLTDKNNNSNADTNSDHTYFNGYDFIKEFDLYDHYPFDLPEIISFPYGRGGRKKHWYCYAIRVTKEGKRRFSKRIRGGCWKKSGNVRNVMGTERDLVVGTRTKFVFWFPLSTKTNWIMYEYALLDHVEASFVVCRVFLKSRAGSCLSENVSGSYANENVPAIRHIGIQHDEFRAPDKKEVSDINCTDHDHDHDHEINASKQTERLDDEPNHATVERIPVGDVEVPTGRSGDELVVPSMPENDSTFVDLDSPQLLLSILEDNFIELNDLVD